ncbi:sensor histidine kinase [Streptomyces sp. RB6PN25]|uniref:histidine kinase n=1 Tax=Streptomyces humicola TaxID=2953240 RepID=A0ABT1PZ37_9ACTN|nr:sensor histidine kinase [Streptomyces humicola]MCQ4082315.1 sensor histidine kinase [Streptomyces humicola]
MRTHTQVDVAEHDEGHATEERNRWFGLWDGYFAIGYAVTTALLFTTGGDQTRRAVAIGALTLAVPWYAALGRGLMAHRTTGRRNIVFATGLFLLFTVAAASDIASSFALFAAVPMLMMALPTPVAIAMSSLANLIPLTVVWLAGGDTRAVLPLSLLGIALSVLLGLWITKVMRQSRERAELIGELRRSQDQLARLSHQAGISAERERLAREIHDTLAQSLISIIGLVQAADSQLADAPDAVRRHLGLAGRMARESLSEARGFVAALTPPALRESSLVEAVQRQTDGLAQQTGLNVRCSVQGTERPLPMAVSVVLLRSVQESVANVRKHAGRARNVDVDVAFEGEAVRLTVRDDGDGFDASQDREGFGLRGLQARAREVNGSATVSSRPGHGTTIEVMVPVKPAVGEPAGER